MKSYCYTAFYINGDFDKSACREIVHTLKIVPDTYWDKDDLRFDQKPFGFSHLEFCTCNQYDVILSNQMEQTIAPLLEKYEQLVALRQKYNLEYSLVVVPHISCDSDEITPCLSPSLVVMDFCSKVRAELEIDYYLED